MIGCLAAFEDTLSSEFILLFWVQENRGSVGEDLDYAVALVSTFAAHIPWPWTDSGLFL